MGSLAVSLSYSKLSYETLQTNNSSSKKISSEIIELNFGVEDDFSSDYTQLEKALGINARKIIDSLNKSLTAKGYKTIEEVYPEQLTPEKTAENVLTGLAAIFAAYKKQNPNLEEEELVNKFLELAREGVETGYQQAVGTLEELSAFDFEGVKEGVEKSKQLILEKLVPENFGIKSEGQQAIDAVN